MRIRIADGRIVIVDDARYLAFDSLRHSPILVAELTGGMSVNARDAQEALAFIVSQLAYTEAQVFERQYIPMQYEELIPISYAAGEWADSIRYEMVDYVGQGKRHSGKGDDIPRVDAQYDEKIMPVFNGAIGYDYTTEELRKSAFLRKPVSETRQVAAVEAYRRHMNTVGLYGEKDSDPDVTGLFNNQYVPVLSAPNGDWDDTATTPQQILADINQALLTVWENTAYNDQVTDIVMAPAAFAKIASREKSEDSDKTILQWIKDNNVAKVERGIDIRFRPGFGLNTAGAAGSRRMLAYVKSDTRLLMHIPMPLRFLSPQLKGLSVEIPGEYKYSGVEWRYPKSALYVDGI
ncbi:MAG: DUF2184 domain-containing protein [Azoarcus sp.]|nr:DUF2184 domain-containing protein [Azoarcus sp.]